MKNGLRITKAKNSKLWGLSKTGKLAGSGKEKK